MASKAGQSLAGRSSGGGASRGITADSSPSCHWAVDCTAGPARHSHSTLISGPPLPPVAGLGTTGATTGMTGTSTGTGMTGTGEGMGQKISRKAGEVRCLQIAKQISTGCIGMLSWELIGSWYWRAAVRCRTALLWDQAG